MLDPTQLRAVTFLRPLSDEELTALSELLIGRKFAARERIIEEGTPVSGLFLICDGTVHIRRLAQKREMLLGRLGVGGFFGEVNLFDPGVATASIYAMKPTLVAYVDYESLRAFMTANPMAGYKMVSGMMTEMSRRLRTTSARLVNVAYWSSAEASVPSEK
jgi:CRP/FNR family cyclic AMP-dependent transcriptional regulator